MLSSWQGGDCKGADNKLDGKKSRHQFVKGIARRAEMQKLRHHLAVSTVSIESIVVDPSFGLRMSVNAEPASLVTGECDTADSFEAWTVAGASPSSRPLPPVRFTTSLRSRLRSEV